MSTATVIVNDGDPVEIETKAVTLVVQKNNDKLTFPGRIELGASDNLYHGERVKTLDPETLGWLARICPCNIEIASADHAREVGSEQLIAAMGMIDLIIKLTGQGVSVVSKYPEAGLHPRGCSELGDFFKWLAKENGK
jgi:hypothetical protein